MALDTEHSGLADATEAAAMRDLYAAAPSAFGMSSVQVGATTVLLAPRLPHAFFNRAIGLGVAQPAGESDLDDVAAVFDEAGIREYWIHVSPASRPALLTAWLEQRGYALPPRRSWAQFLRPTDSVPVAQTTLTVRPAVRAEADAVGCIVCTVYGLPDSLADWFTAIVGRPRWQVCVAEHDGRPVAIGALFVDGERGWLGIGATLPEFRQRGAQSALLAARIEAARQAGCRIVTTETGEAVSDEPNPSLANIRRAGFQQGASRLNFASRI